MSESIPAGNVMKPVTVLLASVALFLMVAVAAHGRPFRIAKTPDKGRTFGCATCHISAQGGGMRNPCGQDYERVGVAAGDKYTEQLGALDSDGDGFSNDAEFAARTHPGDPKSKPSK